jgi:hypothetical protein
MKSPMPRAAAGLALLLTGLIAAGCGEHLDKISSIVNDPAKYARHEVKVAGEVTKVYELPLGITNVAAYRVNDGSGQIWVLSHSGAPREGDKVGLKGTVRDENIKIGTMSLLSVIEEKDRIIK